MYGNKSRKQIANNVGQLKNLPRKFNKDCEGGWRKEVEIDRGI